MLKDPKINFWCKFLVKKNYYICFVCLFVCMFHFHYHSEKIFALISLQNQKAWWWKQLFRQKILDWKVQNLKKQTNYIFLARHRGLVQGFSTAGSQPSNGTQKILKRSLQKEQRNFKENFSFLNWNKIGQQNIFYFFIRP